MAIVIFAVVLSTLCHSKARYGRYTATVAEAMNLISTSYIEQTRPRDLLDGAMDGIAGKLDRYSGYIPPKSLKPFHEQLDQEFSGVGIVVEFNPETERLMVLSPIVGTPAFKAGIQAGDTIMAIDGRDSQGLKSEDAVKLIRGRKGTDVDLTILHVGRNRTRDGDVNQSHRRSRICSGPSSR